MRLNLDSKSWLLALATTAALVSSVKAIAAPYNSGGIMVDADPTWVTGPILADALAMTKPLQRPVLTYHWVQRKLVKVHGQTLPAGPLSPSDRNVRSLIEEDIKERMARFWDLNLAVSGRADTGGAMAPNGLYVANEPVISESYGGSDGLMLQLQFAKGSRYLDGRYDHPAIGASLSSALRARGCAATTAQKLIKSDTNQVACRKALNDIVAATNTALVAYIFHNELFKQDCLGWGSTAFVVIRPDSISRMDYFVGEVQRQDDGLDQIREVINAMFVRYSRPQPFAPLPAASQSTAENFIQQNYFSCNREVREW